MPRIDGQALRAWRRSLGWDVPELARRLRQAARGAPVPTHDSLVRMVRGWEAGRHRMSERYELLYREAGFRAPRATSQRAGSPDTPARPSSVSGPDAGLDDGKGDNGEVHRREFLAASAGLAGLLTVPPQLAHLAVGRKIGSEMPGLLRQRLARLRRLDDYLGGIDTYRAYLAELQATRTLAARAACTGATRTELVRLVSEQAQQTGWAAFDAGWHATATVLYQESLTAAQTAGDRPLEANALALLAYQNLTTGQPAASLAGASCHVAGKTAPPRVRALLNERHAWVITHAGAPSEVPARRALDTAAEALSEDSAAPSPDWASWVDQAELQIMTGRCLTRLGRPDQAISILEEALGSFDERQARDKALYLTWLAEACIATGDIEQAAAVTGRVISLANGVASVRPGQRVAFLLRRLRDRSSAPYVTELADRAAGIIPATWRE
jgi:tetratricopeptide (TPR) repeat protein